MINAKVNGVYTAARQRSGTSDKGPWELIAVTDDEGHSSIAIFVENKPSGVKEGGRFRIDEIDNVTVKHRKDERTNAWWTDVSVRAAVTPIVTMEKAPVVSDDEPSAATMYRDYIIDSGCDDGELPF